MVSGDRRRMSHFYVYAITFDQDVFGIFSTREAAEEDFKRQIEDRGPAWKDCEIERWKVKGEPETGAE